MIILMMMIVVVRDIDDGKRGNVVCWQARGIFFSSLNAVLPVRIHPRMIFTMILKFKLLVSDLERWCERLTVVGSVSFHSVSFLPPSFTFSLTHLTILPLFLDFFLKKVFLNLRVGWSSNFKYFQKTCSSNFYFVVFWYSNYANNNKHIHWLNFISLSFFSWFAI